MVLGQPLAGCVDGDDEGTSVGSMSGHCGVEFDGRGAVDDEVQQASVGRWPQGCVEGPGEERSMRGGKFELARWSGGAEYVDGSNDDNQEDRAGGGDDDRVGVEGEQVFAGEKHSSLTVSREP